MDFISPSQLTTYLSCPLLYFFRYVEHRIPERTSDALVFGQAIHDAVMLGVQRQIQNDPMTTEEADRAFTDLWKLRVLSTPDLEYSIKEDYVSLLEKGRNMVACYFEQAPQDVILDIEKKVTATIPHPDGVLDMPLKGYVDMVVDEDGPLIVELKTAGARYSEDRLATDLQTTAYCLALSDSEDIPFEFRVLLKTKEPRLFRYRISRSSEDYLRFGMIVERVLDGVHRNIFYPHDGSWMCRGCSYRNACKAWSREEVAHACAHA